jgi:hypothetical protein
MLLHLHSREKYDLPALIFVKQVFNSVTYRSVMKNFTQIGQ